MVGRVLGRWKMGYYKGGLGLVEAGNIRLAAQNFKRIILKCKI